MPTIAAATLRRLAAVHDVDPRSILRELREPGSVRGMAGERARKAVSAYQAKEPLVAVAKGAVVR
jgi:carbamoylphosphate synthase small subunit